MLRRRVYILETETNDNFDRVWEIVKEIGAMERHFNQLQHQYRVLSSTWILAIFAATGFILTNERLALGMPKELAITGLTVLGSAGITLLWILDRRVYGMLLRACFNLGLELEYHYPWLPPQRPWLPPLRIKMSESQKLRGATPFITQYYVIGIMIVLALGGVFFVLWSYREGGTGWAILAVGLTIVIISTWCLYLLRTTPPVPLSTPQDASTSRPELVLLR
jgi:hypothetical protein